ncbi:MAG: hypothetical protein Q9220_005271 [cf. Caloplaca sp. 1 TL-2023]
MSIGSQFSLSLELTKLVPFGSLFNAAGGGLVRLLREIQASGSDFITEQDLAEVFGRNQIEARFASNFRTAAKHSVIHEISAIADLVIEGGAGPTVRRSLNESGYFSMVVQLSLLTFAHDLSSLTNGLVKAFEGRNKGAKEYVAPPRYDALKDPLFHLVAEKHEGLLLPTRRHPLRDYGTRVLRLQNDDQEVESRMVEAIVTSCLIMEHQERRGQTFGPGSWSDLRSFPSMRQILMVSKLLFAANEATVDAISLDSIGTFNDFTQPLKKEHRISVKDLYRLSHTIIALCMTHGFDEGLSLHVDSLEETQYLPFRVPDARTAFASLASLLEGRGLQEQNSDLERTSLVSAWGWSLCLGSLSCLDPSDAKSELTFIRGMPARGGERKRYIRDGARPIREEVTSKKYTSISSMFLTAGPGESITLESWITPEKPWYFIGVTDNAFEVTNIYSCASSIIGRYHISDLSIPMGFRSMQEVSWDAVQLPACEHIAASSRSIVLPDKVWTIQGFKREGPIWKIPNDALFVGLTAGDSAARWILTAMMLYAWESSLHPLHVCIRGRNCCFECAIKFAKNSKPDAFVGLVL